MKFEHTIEIAAPESKVRTFLNDFERAALCLPDVEEATSVGGDAYEGKVRVKVGPIGFNINGKATVQTRDDGTWTVDGEGRDPRVGAGVRASLEARLRELAADNTEVAIEADVQFSGALAGLGQSVIRKKADAMIQEFASNLQRAIAAEP